MTDFNTFSVILASISVLIAFLSFGKLRLRQLVRYYAMLSLFLAGAIAAIGMEEMNRHFFLTALATAVVKGFAIPFLFFWMTRTMHLNERLLSSVHPTLSHFLAAATIGLALLSSVTAGPIFGPVAGNGLFLAFAFLFLGVLMIIIRRDLISQIMGFLIFENGISYLTIVTVGGVRYLPELGILVTVLVSAYLVSLLSLRLKGLYAIEDTAALKEFVE